MSSKVRLDLTIPTSEATFLGKTRPSNSTPHRNFDALSSYMAAIAGAIYAGAMVETTGAVNATATITSAGSASNNETMTVANTTLTAKTSGAVAANGEFNISGTVATQATNIAAAINAVSALSGIVTATHALGVVTVTAVAPGTIGNGLEIDDNGMTNVTATAFASGVDGHTYTYSIGQ